MKKNPMLEKFMEMKDNLDDKNIHLAGAMAAILLAEHEFAEEKTEKTEEAMDDIEDELHGAEKYTKMYIACHDPVRKEKLRQMAHDEIRHAEFFMTEAYQMASTMEEKANLDSKKMWHDSLVARLR